MPDTTDNEIIVLIDAASAIKEKRMIAFTAEVEDGAYKFIMSIADFAAFGVDNAGNDPAGSVEAIQAGLTRLIAEKVRKGELQATTKLSTN